MAAAKPPADDPGACLTTAGCDALDEDPEFGIDQQRDRERAAEPWAPVAPAPLKEADPASIAAICDALGVPPPDLS